MWFTVCNTHSVSKVISHSYKFYCNWHTHMLNSIMNIFYQISPKLDNKCWKHGKKTSLCPLSEEWLSQSWFSQKSQIIQYVFVEISAFHETHGSFRTYLLKSVPNFTQIRKKILNDSWQCTDIIYALLGFVSHNGRKMLKIWVKFHVFS
jgi:hypothetical protein